MSLIFPDNPQINDQTTTGGRVWVWDGYRWVPSNPLGYTGSLGFTGSVGFSGSIGDLGYTGSRGAFDAIGFTGSKGDQGSTGFTGSTGSQGPLGYTGSIGFTGSRGDTGFTGSQGSLGYTGSQGPQGDNGGVGYQGSAGVQGSVGFTGSTGQYNQTITTAISDEYSVVTTGTAKMTVRAPFALTLTDIPRAFLANASTSGLVTVDIKLNGTSILGTNKLSIDANEKTSKTAATPTTLVTTAVADDDEITYDITAAGTNAKGLKVTVYFVRN